MRYHHLPSTFIYRLLFTSKQFIKYRSNSTNFEFLLVITIRYSKMNSKFIFIDKTTFILYSHYHQYVSRNSIPTHDRFLEERLYTTGPLWAMLNTTNDRKGTFFPIHLLQFTIQCLMWNSTNARFILSNMMISHHPKTG